MIQRMSDEQIKEYCNTFIDGQLSFSERVGFVVGYTICQDNLIPQIEKMQEEIERLKAENMSFRNVIKLANESLWKDSEQIKQLTEKHEALVKRLRDTQNIPMSLNSGYVRYDVIESIITESENRG